MTLISQNSRIATFSYVRSANALTFLVLFFFSPYISVWYLVCVYKYWAYFCQCIRVRECVFILVTDQNSLCIFKVHKFFIRICAFQYVICGVHQIHLMMMNANRIFFYLYKICVCFFFLFEGEGDGGEFIV